MSMVAFDTLKLARRLREAGMPQEQAEAVADAEAEALSEFVLANLATKGDIAEVKGEIAEVKGEIAEVKGDIADLRGELKGDIAKLDQRISGLKGEVAEVKGDIDARFERMDRKFTIYFTVILFTMIFLNQSALEFIARLLGLVK